MTIELIDLSLPGVWLMDLCHRLINCMIEESVDLCRGIQGADVFNGAQVG